MKKSRAIPLPRLGAKCQDLKATVVLAAWTAISMPTSVCIIERPPTGCFPLSATYRETNRVLREH